MMRWPWILLALALGGCGDDDGVTPKADPDAGDPDAGDLDAGDPDADDGSDGGNWCGSSGVSKGPWVMHVDGTSALVRWEACRAGTSPELSFAPEAGGATTQVDATVKAVDIPNTYVAGFAPQQPADLAGTYYMHDAALTGLTAGTCYSYTLTADATRKGRFCSSRPSGTPFKILAVGDTNPGLGSTQKLLAQVAPENYDLTLHEGDIQYYASGLETWQYWFGEMAPMFAQGAFLPAIGNHEHEKPDEFELYTMRFFDQAGFDGKNGWFRAESGGVWFFALNTEESLDPGSEQLTWLQTQLADAAAKPGYRFGILMIHRPFLTCGDTSQSDGDRQNIQPLLEQHGVPLVLQGHMHGYERFEVPMTSDPSKTITYLTVAGGGGAIGDLNANIDRPTCSMRVESGAYYHMEVLEVAAGTLSGKTVDVNGQVTDTFSKSVP